MAQAADLMIRIGETGDANPSEGRLGVRVVVSAQAPVYL
jgi:hypothetical protein